MRYVGTKKRQRLEQADDDDEMDEQAAACMVLFSFNVSLMGF